MREGKERGREEVKRGKVEMKASEVREMASVICGEKEKRRKVLEKIN